MDHRRTLPLPPAPSLFHSSSPNATSGWLLTAGNDRSVCHWDLTSTPVRMKAAGPERQGAALWGHVLNGRRHSVVAFGRRHVHCHGEQGQDNSHVYAVPPGQLPSPLEARLPLGQSCLHLLHIGPPLSTCHVGVGQWPHGLA